MTTNDAGIFTEGGKQEMIMKQKTNRDVLWGLCVYDLLCRINDGLRKIDGGDVCVVDALNGHYVHSLHCVDKSCDKCILEYLDKEAKA